MRKKAVRRKKSHKRKRAHKKAKRQVPKLRKGAQAKTREGSSRSTTEKEEGSKRVEIVPKKRVKKVMCSYFMCDSESELIIVVRGRRIPLCSKHYSSVLSKMSRAVSSGKTEEATLDDLIVDETEKGLLIYMP